MPLIKLITSDGERLLEADRVVRDSRVYVVEARRSGIWERVAVVPAGSVRSVLRRVPGPGEPTWLGEDVRTAAGLEGTVSGPLARETRSLSTLFRLGLRDWATSLRGL